MSAGSGENITPAGGARKFQTGATRDVDGYKLNYEGHFSPLALRFFAEYAHGKRFLADGSIRAADNWQLGIPLNSYMESLLRHVMELWLAHRGYASEERLKEALGGIWFNVQGYTHELLKKQK